MLGLFIRHTRECFAFSEEILRLMFTRDKKETVQKCFCETAKDFVLKRKRFLSCFLCVSVKHHFNITFSSPLLHQKEQCPQ